jgi:hypothetical protein
MATHETTADWRKLVRDLADMYPFDVTEVVIVELIANCLDARPERIKISIGSRRGKPVLVVEDDGRGMSEREFHEYHRFAATLKRRGSGIGFAGLGAKISFNIADRVITETRSASFSGASDWSFRADGSLKWDDIAVKRLRGRGTRVEVRFRPAERLFYPSSEDLIALLRRHYLPLLDSKFLELYQLLGCYSRRLRFVVNGQRVRPFKVAAEFSLEKVRRFRPERAGRQFGYGIFGLAASEYPVSPDICGVLLCTRGKVIKGDLFNQFPGPMAPRLFGMVEAPDFVNFLTTPKTDFVRAGRHREFERLYDPIRQEFKSWLKGLGIETAEAVGTEEAARLEKELRKLVEEVPELGQFFGFRSTRKALVEAKEGPPTAGLQEGMEQTFPVGEGEGNGGEGPGIAGEGEQPGEALAENVEGGDRPAKPISRTGRRGPKVAFVEAPDRIDLAWVDGNNVVINSGHPAYVKVRPHAGQRRLHSLFAIASAVQSFLGTAGGPDSTFVDRMMAAWGKS